MNWEDVRARSQVGSTYCFDCEMNFAAIEMGCQRHTLPSEVAERDRRFTEQINNGRMSEERPGVGRGEE